MGNNSMVLYRTMKASTSHINVIRYSKDKKKRNAALGAVIGYAFLGLAAVLFVGMVSYGMSSFGFQDMVPALVASFITLITLFLTLFKSNGYMYAFKDYDMLMSLPFPVRTIVSNRFLLMYASDLPWNVLVSLSALAGYAIVIRPGIFIYVSWILLTPFIPLLPTVVMSLLGVFIANIGSKFRHKKLIQSILIFICVIPLFFIRFIIDYLVANDKVGDLIEQTADTLSGLARLIPSIGWFVKAVINGDVLSFILLVGVSLAVYIGMVLLISRNYRRINSRLTSSAARHRSINPATGFRPRSIISTVAYKDFKTIMGSSLNIVNLGMGSVLSILLGLILPFINIKDLVESSLGDQISFNISDFALLWPVLIYFFVGMCPVTAPGPSLEGKNYWIIKSLPVDMLKVSQGRIVLNLYFNLIPGLFAMIGGMIALRAHFLDYILGILMLTSMVLFSTTYGLRCGLKHIRLDWENEIEVVKQGTAVTAYILPNMLAVMPVSGLMILSCFSFGIQVAALFITVVYGVLAFCNYNSVKKLSREA